MNLPLRQITLGGPSDPFRQANAKKRIFKRIILGLVFSAIAAIIYAFVWIQAVFGSNLYSFKWADFKTRLTSEQFCDFCPRMAKIEAKGDYRDASRAYMSVFAVTVGDWLKCEEHGKCDVVNTRSVREASTSEEKRERYNRLPVVDIPDRNLHQYIDAVSSVSGMTCSLPTVDHLQISREDISYAHFCGRSDSNMSICRNNFSENFSDGAYDAKVGMSPLIASGKFYDLFNDGWEKVKNCNRPCKDPIALWNGGGWLARSDLWGVSYLRLPSSYLESEGRYTSSMRMAAFRVYCSAN